MEEHTASILAQTYKSIGSSDGKHISIKAEPWSGSAFINCKGNISVVLLAVADVDGLFETSNVGEFHRNSDG